MITAIRGVYSKKDLAILYSRITDSEVYFLYCDFVKESRGQTSLVNVAKKTGLSIATLSRVENGQKINFASFLKLNKWLLGQEVS